MENADCIVLFIYYCTDTWKYLELDTKYCHESEGLMTIHIQLVIFPSICTIIYLTGFSKNNYHHETIMIRSFYKVKPRPVIILNYHHLGSKKC